MSKVQSPLICLSLCGSSPSLLQRGNSSDDTSLLLSSRYISWTHHVFCEGFSVPKQRCFCVFLFLWSEVILFFSKFRVVFECFIGLYGLKRTVFARPQKTAFLKHKHSALWKVMGLWSAPDLNNSKPVTEGDVPEQSQIHANPYPDSIIYFLVQAGQYFSFWTVTDSLKTADGSSTNIIIYNSNTVQSKNSSLTPCNHGKIYFKNTHCKSLLRSCRHTGKWNKKGKRMSCI